MQNLIKIHLINHLKVTNDRAEEAKEFLKDKGYLNSNYLPIKGDNFVLWPLIVESVPFEGKIIRCDGIKYVKQSRDYRSKLNDEIRDLAPRSFDIFGEIAIIKLVDDLRNYEKEIAEALLLSHTNVRTVCLDSGVHGEFRLRDLRLIGGENNFVSIHKENGMEFEADISKVYFSPRLATERERISSLVQHGEFVLDAFAGVAPFSISLAKKGCKLLSLDSNPEAKKWALKNFSNNGISKNQYNFYNSKFEDFDFKSKKFDRIIMNNPTNCLHYLEKALNLVAKNGTIHFYNICPKDETFSITNHINSDYECIGKNIVHAYSPSSSLFAFDIRRNSI
ncbi:MAG: hypothetical protein CMB62_03780 [Euryarchaeota archaeon]|nr:hypothetical protein [Euryarchaeota archaeon]|tara:strand:+ start:22647 stop:23654 length:1008 start_codon:yes stop_codon:yes gene_type:complete